MLFRTLRKLTTGLGIALSLAACAASEPPPPPQPSLTSTIWQLIEIRSMDDSGPNKGITLPANPERYTAIFNPDRSLNMQLDCNRGRGGYVATPSETSEATGTSGELRITPMAMTRMACLPPSLGDKVAKDMDYVRSYRIKDGRLYLSLMADGGIYVWAPQAK